MSHEDLVLAAADGNRFAAFLATPDDEPKAGVVILPDVRGVHRFYEELALRFAERGYAAIAIDYFGRTAGIEKRPNDWDYMTHTEQTTDEGVQADTRAIGFYGSPTRRSGGASAVERVGELETPILALQAGDDANITAEDNATFDKALSDAGIEHEIITYDGAPHSFFDRKQEEFQDASDDAWRRTLALIDAHA